VAWRQPPLLPPIAGQLTARGPMRRLYDRAAEMERDPRVVTISIFAGFPLADIRDAGLSVYVATDGDPGLADRLADELTAIAWAHRREFLHTALPVREAVAHALAADGRPVVLADIADNTGGGAAADPADEKILVVQPSVHYRAAFEPLAHAIIEVDAPGLSSSNLARFTFKLVRRPIFPLDDV